MVKELDIEPGIVPNSIDQVLFGSEESWSVDEIFSEGEGNGSDENWLEDLAAQL